MHPDLRTYLLDMAVVTTTMLIRSQIQIILPADISIQDTLATWLANITRVPWFEQVIAEALLNPEHCIAILSKRKELVANTSNEIFTLVVLVHFATLAHLLSANPICRAFVRRLLPVFNRLILWDHITKFQHVFAPPSFFR